MLFKPYCDSAAETQLIKNLKQSTLELIEIPHTSY